MTQSSSRDPRNIPLEGQAARDLKIVLKGLNYDLDAELESFRKWRQQTQKPLNAQAQGLVPVPQEASRSFRSTGNMRKVQTAPKMPDLSPVAIVAGALITLSLGSIMWFFTHSGGQGSSTPPAVTSEGGQNLQSGPQSAKNSAKSEPLLSAASAPKIQAKSSTQVQPSKPVVAATSDLKSATFKGTIKKQTSSVVTKPILPVAVPKKSSGTNKPGAFSTFKGYGYYYVFVPVDGAKDLGRLKEIFPGAYPRVIDGRTYMQMAAYDTDRRAQILAGQLRQRGYTVEVKK